MIAQPSTPPVRHAVAVLLSRFPSVTETFILREVIEMERQGQPVRLVPLLRESPPVVHAEAVPWVEQALYTPFLSPAVLAANLRALARRPGRYLTMLANLLVRSAGNLRFLVHSLGLFPKSIYLAERLRQEGIGHVHAHFASHPATAALIISAFADATFSITVHAHDLFVRQYQPALGWRLERAAFIRVISRFNRDYLLSRFPRISPAKVHVVHVGVDSERDAGQGPEATPAWRATGAVPRVLSVAGLRPYKGIPVLLEACRRLRDDGLQFRCDIVGDGPLRPRIERLIHRWRLHGVVRLLGARPQHEVRALLRDRPIFALPSVILRNGWMEGIPVALMEAMAARSPVVASRLSGIPELVEDGVTGLLVEPGNPAELAAAIRRLMEAPELVDRLAAGGQKRVRERFDLTRCVGELVKLIGRHNPSVVPAISDAVDRVRIRYPSETIGVRRLHQGRDAVIAELAAAGGELPPDLVLKVHLDVPGAPRGPGERARHEFEVLRRLAPGPRPRGLHCPSNSGVPRTIHLDHQLAAVLMERSDGRSLAHLIRATRGSIHPAAWETLTAAVERTGDWLAEVQRRTRGWSRPEAALAGWWSDAGTDLERCRPLLPPELCKQLQARLEAAHAHLATAGLEPVASHGDFGPGNVLVTSERVGVIDFEGTRAGLPGEDAAYFLIQLELFFDYPFMRRRSRRLSEAFLRGYGTGRPADQVVQRACRISKALQILARSDGAGSPGSGARAWRRRRCLARILEQSAT